MTWHPSAAVSCTDLPRCSLPASSETPLGALSAQRMAHLPRRALSPYRRVLANTPHRRVHLPHRARMHHRRVHRPHRARSLHSALARGIEVSWSGKRRRRRSAMRKRMRRRRRSAMRNMCTQRRTATLLMLGSRRRSCETQTFSPPGDEAGATLKSSQGTDS